MSALTDTAPGTPLVPTPSNTSQSAPPLPKETPYLHTPTAYLISDDLDLNVLIEKSHPPTLKPHDPPTARELHTLHDRIRDNLLKSFEKRGETCERNLRAVVQKRKESTQAERDREAAEQQAAADRIKKERDDGGSKTKKTGQKRSHAEAEGAEEKRESVPSVGEHMLARQDGVGVHEGKFCCVFSFCNVGNFLIIAGSKRAPSVSNCCFVLFCDILCCDCTCRAFHDSKTLRHMHSLCECEVLIDMQLGPSPDLMTRLSSISSSTSHDNESA